MSDDFRHRIRMTIIKWGARRMERRVVELKRKLAQTEEILRRCKVVIMRDGLDRWQ